MNCHNNLRSIALAKAIVAKYNFKGSLSCFLNTSIGKNLKILSVNTAGGLHKTLNKVKNYKLAEFPEHDMTNLGFEDGTFDLVIHSDTLEHVPSPLLGLQECRRVLADGGSCIFTIPIIIGRLSVDRKGKKASYHGNSDTLANDWVVQTEYGADAWTDGFRAGFSNVQIHCLEYPSAFAMQLNK